jgi:hypothetical protein
MTPEPIERLDLDAADLVAHHPPRWEHEYKQIIWDISSPPGSVHAGRIGYSRWPAFPLPYEVDSVFAAGRVAIHHGVYDYERSLLERDAIEWHVNFADPNLFGAYPSGLMAQDEWQVAEHPALGSLVEALHARDMAALTQQDGRPTPVLVTHVERRCRIDTDVNPAEGRPLGLYGGAFVRARPDAVRRATHRIHPPTVSHIIAIAAPAYGHGRYTPAQVSAILTIAYTGFRAAVLESRRMRGSEGPVAVHSGFWGCGVFGNDRLMMSMLQMLAAEMAGLDRLVMHAVKPEGATVVEEARHRLRSGVGGAGDVQGVIERIVAMGIEWHESDGN